MKSARSRAVFTFFGTSILALAVLSADGGRVNAGAILSVVQFGLICAMAVVVFSTSRQDN